MPFGLGGVGEYGFEPLAGGVDLRAAYAVAAGLPVQGDVRAGFLEEAGEPFGVLGRHDRVGAAGREVDRGAGEVGGRVGL